MERIDATEGGTTRFGGFTIAWVHGRGGRIVALVNTGEGETADDVKAAGRRLKEKIDKAVQTCKNSS